LYIFRRLFQISNEQKRRQDKIEEHQKYREDARLHAITDDHLRRDVELHRGPDHGEGERHNCRRY
ncbi:MAG: hypothetical protein OSB69_16585, partial [Alphaproteobacteria bacterium]|nr:hypothetical protein [Alphaproteobacteria bacterium]